MARHWLEAVWKLSLRRQRTMMLHRILGFGSVVVVHWEWQLTHLPLLVFLGSACSCSMVQVLAIDIIEYLHLTSLRSQAHFPMAINWTLRSPWIS